MRAAVVIAVLCATAQADELVHTVETVAPRDDLSAFLVAPAKKAVDGSDLARAIPLLRALVAARGPGSAEAKQLATALAQAGLDDEAIAVFSAYAAAANDADAKERAAKLPRESGRFAVVDAPDLAKQAFAAGRKAFDAKHYGDALVDFHMGYALAPDLPGFLRELGATYDKLGADGPKRELYKRYLAARPFGASADAIRKELPATDLGTLAISTSLPCGEVWLNAEKLPAKVDSLQVAPGTYKGLCFHAKYEMALYAYATVEAGKTATLAFQWAIVVNALDKPLGRIALENPASPGTMIDLGITSNEIGVAVSPGKKLQMVIQDDTGGKSERRTVEIAPGQRFVVKW